MKSCIDSQAREIIDTAKEGALCFNNDDGFPINGIQQFMLQRIRDQGEKQRKGERKANSKGMQMGNNNIYKKIKIQEVMSM